jgi:hypothetical protein
MVTPDDARGLPAPGLGLPVLDALELEQALIGTAVGQAEELGDVIGQFHFDRHAVLLEEGHDVGVDKMHGGEGHLVSVEAAQEKPGQSIAV